jgi:mono/diheme cytochrome c family protein
MKLIKGLLALLVFLALIAGGIIWSGAYNMAADEPHWPLTEQLVATLRDRSIAARQSGAGMPDLDDESLIRAGAGNYEAMCDRCHLEPGEDATEISRGLYPAPPDLTRKGVEDPAEAFWVIKHGIKMTGMPAWGKSMDDGSIWGMVAFIRKLPGMSEEQYHELVESSEGHTHGPGVADHEHKD